MRSLSLALAYVFAAAALWFGWSAFTMETSVIVDGQPVANFELMHYQSQNIALAVGATIAAAIIFASSAIVAALRPE